MQKLFILIGLPASGKSTWADKQPNVIRVSSDLIRKELYGDESIQDNPQKVFSLVHKRIFENLAAGYDVAYDAMNIKRKYRAEFIKEVRAKFPEEKLGIFGIFFATPFEMCIEANRTRERQVPEYVMVRAYKGFNVPDFAEGFQDIFIEKRVEDSYYLPHKLIESFDISQDNPHHSLTIGKHCAEAYLYIKQHHKEICEEMGKQWAHDIALAAISHDIGKSFCKTYTKPNGQLDDKAHFYGHESVGAYDFLCYADKDNVRLDKWAVALLINLHMIRYMDSKYQEKIKNFYQPQIWQALEWLNKADLAAH